MRKLTAVVAGALVISALLIWTGERATLAAPDPLETPPSFESAECMFDPLIPGMVDTTIECGYLTVPEQRFGDGVEGDDKTIRIAVAIMPSQSTDPEPDPLFVAQGGPGGSTIDTYANLLGNHPIRDKRDIVLFDQRGTLYSEPNLLCTESFDAVDELLTLSEEEAEERTRQAEEACRQRLVDEGVNLAAYNSLENAADVEELRVALGYDDINFYGVSYGTLLGLHFMRDFPEHVRSVILDGVVPTQTNFITQVAQSQERVFAEFFAACRKDDACSYEYPDLEERFFAVVEQLNEEPAHVTLVDPETGQRMAATLLGDDVVDFLFQMFYISGSVGILPAVVADLERGDHSYVETMYSLFLFDRTMSEGMYSSVICAEEAGFDAGKADLGGVRPQFAETAGDDLQEVLDSCAGWDVPVLPDAANEPVESEIPTLLLSGQFDPVTPSRFAETAKETLPNSFSYVLPTGGHGVAFLVDECMDEIVLDFLADPDVEPSSTCLDLVAPIDFLPDNTITVPVLARLNSLGRNAWIHVGVSALLFVGILSALVIWPLGWVVRTIRGRDVERSEEERRWRWGGRLLVVAFGGVAMMFVFSFMLVLGFVVIPSQGMTLLSAVPRGVTPLFLLPFALALLAAAILFVAIRYWGRGEGSIWGRFYYSFLAICAVGYVIVLYLDGMFGVIF